MNRNQKILTGLALVASLLIVADYKSASLWKTFGWDEIDKTPPSFGWHLFEIAVIACCYVGLFYLLRRKASNQVPGKSK